MLEEVLGLPTHPLLVHAPVMLVPLLIAVAIGYALVPPWRRPFGWAVVLLALLAPSSVALARFSGEAFQVRLAEAEQLPPQLAQQVNDHAAHSWILLWSTVGLGVAAILMVIAGRGLRRRLEEAYDDEFGEPSPRGGMLLVMTLLVLVVLGLSGASGWYLYQTGDSGARMVWEGS